MQTASSAYLTGYVSASSVEYTATVFTPSSRAARMMRSATLAAVGDEDLLEH
jgi:hypothetical protein